MGVAISSRGGGRDRSTDGLHTEPSGHFKLYSPSLRVKDRAQKKIGVQFISKEIIFSNINQKCQRICVFFDQT